MSDFNVKARTLKDKEGTAMLRRLLELGFDHIAWNHTIFGKPTQANLSSLPKASQSLSTVESNASSVYRKMSSSSLTAVCQYQRLTINIDEFSEAQCLHSSNEILKSFDIIAASPSNAKVLGYLCREADIDIISFDFSRHLPFSIVKKTIDEAVTRGIFFEIKVGPCLHNSAHRREIINGVKNLVRVLRGRNIIITSGSENSMQLRGPLDLQNLGRLLQLSEIESHQAVFESWRNILQHAASRRRRNHPVQLTSYQHLLQTLSQHNAIHDSQSSKRKRPVLEEESEEVDELEEKDTEIPSAKRVLVSDDSGIMLFD